MHLTVVRMLHNASPELRDRFEHDGPVEGSLATPEPPAAEPGGHRPRVDRSPSMTTPAPAAAKRGKEWLDNWDPEDEATWDKSLAWRTLWITTFALTLAFVAVVPGRAPSPRSSTTSASTSARTSSTG